MAIERMNNQKNHVKWKIRKCNEITHSKWIRFSNFESFWSSVSTCFCFTKSNHDYNYYYYFFIPIITISNRLNGVNMFETAFFNWMRCAYLTSQSVGAGCHKFCVFTIYASIDIVNNPLHVLFDQYILPPST